jgi:hypothetical protein
MHVASGGGRDWPLNSYTLLNIFEPRPPPTTEGDGFKLLSFKILPLPRQCTGNWRLDCQPLASLECAHSCSLMAFSLLVCLLMGGLLAAARGARTDRHHIVKSNWARLTANLGNPAESTRTPATFLATATAASATSAPAMLPAFARAIPVALTPDSAHFTVRVSVSPNSDPTTAPPSLGSARFATDIFVTLDTGSTELVRFPERRAFARVPQFFNQIIAIIFSSATKPPSTCSTRRFARGLGGSGPLHARTHARPFRSRAFGSISGRTSTAKT